MEYCCSITHRLYIEHDLLIGTAIQIEGFQANYLLSALRMKNGGRILLFNGRHGEWLGEIINVRRKTCYVKLLNQTRIQSEPYDLTYIFAPLKKGRLDYMVQKVVEMGAGILQPVFTCYTQVSKINMHRLQANAIKAAEQCSILSVPRISSPLNLTDLIENWNEKHSIIYCDETKEKDDIIKILTPFRGKKLAVLIGPEGGFSEEERKFLKEISFIHPVSLGARILRADTAAVAVLAILQAAAGDW